MDEARIGQKGRLTHVWYQKGVRPRGRREQRFASAQLFGAVCPERDAGVALVLPEVSTAAMSTFLAELARAVPAGTHAALVLDGAGWHVSDELSVPANLTLIHPPPYSPELNPVAQVLPHPLDRVQLRAVGRQRDQGQVRRHGQVVAHVPAGPVEHQPGVAPGRDRA